LLIFATPLSFRRHELFISDVLHFRLSTGILPLMLNSHFISEAAFDYRCLRHAR